jgi:hypothetical protein
MIKNNLLNFLKKEYGEGYNELLEDLIKRNDITDITSENKSKLRILAKDLRDSLPTISIAKRNLLFSEIIKILKLDVDNIGSEKIKDETTVENKKNEDEKVKKFVKNIEKILIKYETIFNLFWLRAGDAEIEGINHEDILKKTQKALIGIKNELEKNRNEILTEYNLLEMHIQKQKNNFHFKTGSLIENKINQKNEEEYKNKKIIKDKLDIFWKNVNQYYNEFKTIFIESMEEDIKLKKQGKDDTKLIEETKKKMINLWNKLEKAYENFENEVKNN